MCSDSWVHTVATFNHEAALGMHAVDNL